MHTWVEQYIAEKTMMGELTTETATNYASVLRRFVTSTSKPPDELERADLMDHLASLGGKPGTQRWRIAVLRSFFGWCVETRLLTYSPAAGLRSRTPTVREPRFLEPEQVGPVMTEALTTRDRLIVVLGVQVGLRRKEVWELNVADISWDDDVIAIRGKGHSGEVSRLVPITTELRSALRAYIIESPPFVGTGELVPLIRNFRGGRLSKTYISVLVSRAMTQAGVKERSGDGKSMHALRHTCFQHLADAGHDIREIQALAGHTSQTTTEIYLRRKVARERLRMLTEGRRYGMDAS